MKKTREQLTKSAEVALRALELNCLTQADRERVAAVWLGLRSLDDEQAEAKECIERLRPVVLKHEPPPVWGECVCMELAKKDRPCVVCVTRAEWLADRGLPPRLTGAENAFFLAVPGSHQTPSVDYSKLRWQFRQIGTKAVKR